MSLYRKYRPQTFSEIVDQDHIVKPLLSQLENGKITHAYLFSGPRGTGKTSTARIFAKSLNCEKYKKTPSTGSFGEPCNKCQTCQSITDGRNFDVIELDAASNRGIDEIRDLREKVNLAPSSGRYKIYIIDEAHQLTNEAFNALLKTLEEPPAHAVFILATTEAHKIPATIASRTQRYEFKLSAKTKDKLKQIEEGGQLSDESIDLIAKLSGGSFRDAEVLLEKVVATDPKAKPESVQVILGKVFVRGVSPFDLILQKKTREAVTWLQNFSGDYKVLGESLLETLRDLLLIKVGVLTAESAKYSPAEFNELANFSEQISTKKLQKWLELFSEATAEIKDSPIPVLPLELAVIEACEFGTDQPIDNQIATEESVTATSYETEKGRETKLEQNEVKLETKISNPPRKDLNKIEEIEKNWSEILQKVRAKNNSLGVFLRNAKPAEIDQGLLVLEVYFQFHKDLVEEPKNSNLIAGVIEETLGKPVRIIGKVGIRPEKKTKTTVELNQETDPAELFGKLN